MNNDNGSINFKVGLDNTQLQADAAKSKMALKGIGDTGQVEGNKIGSAFSAASGMIGMMALAAVGSIGMLGKTILDTTAKFERFGVVLRNTLGDARGNDALDMIKDFAATTPFQLDEITDAFVRMANQGFVPTREEMIKLGDLASATGKSFGQLAEAVLDAQTGEFERLKEFGIKARSEGDKVTFSFKEQQTTVEKSNKAIQGYLIGLGDLTGVMGANEKISASLTGKMSNLGDKFATMYNEIGTANSGILYAAVDGTATLIENYETIGEVVGGLIAIYGLQKVAIFAINYAETAKAISIQKSIALETQYQAVLAGRSITAIAYNANTTVEIAQAKVLAEAKLRVAAAETKIVAAKSAKMMVQPYMLAAMAVTALGYAMYKLITTQTDLQKSQERLNKTVADVNLSIAKEAVELDIMFGRLKAAKEGTKEYEAAKKAIFSKYGEQLKSLGDEKTALNDIALAYATITEKALEAAKARGMEKITSEAAASTAEALAASRTKIDQLLQEKFKGQKDEDGIDLAQVYFAKIVPVIEGKEEATKEIWDIVRQFDEQVTTYVGGGANAGKASTAWSNLLNDEITNANTARKILEDTMADARVQFGEIQTKKEADPVLTTYADQMAAIRKTRAEAVAELERLKNTPGVDPLKEINAKKAEIAELDKQLGIKEVAEKTDRIEQIKKLMEKAHGAELTRLAKELALEEAKKKVVEDRIATEMAIARNQQIAPLGAKTQSETLELMKKASGLDFSKLVDTEREDRKKLRFKLEVDKLEKHSVENNKKLVELLEQQAAQDRARASYMYDIAESAQYLASQFGESNRELAGMLTAISSIAGQLARLQEKGFEISKEEGISMAVAGATQLVGMAIRQAAENKRVMKEYYASIISQQQQYNILLNEQLRLNSDIKGSIFIQDFEGRLTDGAKAYNDAQKKFQEEFKKFAESEAITGKKNVVSGTNVLSGIGAGAALGAGIGTLIAPGIGTVIGAAVGTLVGALTGLFAKKKKDIVAPLIDVYPDLIDANGEFNAELAKTLIANNKVTEATKQTLQNLIEWKEAADAATEQLKQVISDLAGSLGNDIRNALVEAFRSGEDAAKEFGKSVDKVLETILSNMLFNQAFEGLFKTLQDDMLGSYSAGGDQSWFDDLTRFFEAAPESMKVFLQGLSDAKKAGEAVGFNLFKNDSERTGSSKGIAAMSQDSADELNGRFTAIQGHTFSINEGVKVLTANSGAILKHLSGIEKNTDRLEAIEVSIGAVKTGIDTINLKGLKIQ